MGAHPAELGELAACQAASHAADQDHEERDQRRGDEQHDSGQGIEGENDGQHAQRNQQGQDELGQILADIRVERFDPGDGRVGQLAAALAAGVGGAEGDDPGVQALAQVALDALGGLAGDRVAAPRHHRAQDDHGQQGSQQRRDVAQPLFAQEDAGYDLGEQPRLGDQQQPARRAEQDRAPEQNSHCLKLAQQPPVKIHDRVSRVTWLVERQSNW